MTERSVPLPARLRVDEVAALKAALVQALEGLDPTDALVLGAETVEDVDAAGLQLVYAVRRSCAARGVRFRLNDPSEHLLRGGRVLGLSFEGA